MKDYTLEELLDNPFFAKQAESRKIGRENLLRWVSLPYENAKFCDRRKLFAEFLTIPNKFMAYLTCQEYKTRDVYVDFGPYMNDERIEANFREHIIPDLLIRKADTESFMNWVRKKGYFKVSRGLAEDSPTINDRCWKFFENEMVDPHYFVNVNGLIRAILIREQAMCLLREKRPGESRTIRDVWYDHIKVPLFRMLGEEYILGLKDASRKYSMILSKEASSLAKEQLWMYYHLHIIDESRTGFFISDYNIMPPDYYGTDAERAKQLLDQGLTEDQMEHVLSLQSDIYLVFCEKEASVRAIQPVCESYCAHLISGAGFDASARVEYVAQDLVKTYETNWKRKRIKEIKDLTSVFDPDWDWQDHKELADREWKERRVKTLTVTIIILSDFDPMGFRIAKDIENRFNALSWQLPATYNAFRFGISPSQVDPNILEDKLFPVPLARDTQTKKWMDEHAIRGRYGIEIQALTKPELRALLIEILDAVVNENVMYKVKSEQALRRIPEETASTLRSDYCRPYLHEVRDALGKFRDDTEASFKSHTDSFVGDNIKRFRREVTKREFPPGHLKSTAGSGREVSAWGKCYNEERETKTKMKDGIEEDGDMPDLRDNLEEHVGDFHRTIRMVAEEMPDPGEKETDRGKCSNCGEVCDYAKAQGDLCCLCNDNDIFDDGFCADCTKRKKIAKCKTCGRECLNTKDQSGYCCNCYGRDVAVVCELCKAPKCLHCGRSDVHTNESYDTYWDCFFCGLTWPKAMLGVTPRCSDETCGSEDVTLDSDCDILCNKCGNYTYSSCPNCGSRSFTVGDTSMMPKREMEGDCDECGHRWKPLLETGGEPGKCLNCDTDDSDELRIHPKKKNKWICQDCKEELNHEE